VTTETATGSSSSVRVRLNLTLVVDKVVYSALALSEAAAASTSSTSAEPATTSTAGQPTSGTATLHVSGPVSSENPHVKKGAFHTLDLEVGRDFTIVKLEGEWDSIARERIREVTEPTRGAEVGAILCGEGMANICLITNHTTIIRQRIDVPVPRKRKGGTTALGAEKVRRMLIPLETTTEPDPSLRPTPSSTLRSTLPWHGTLTSTRSRSSLSPLRGLPRTPCINISSKKQSFVPPSHPHVTLPTRV
jgi:hypothetical protein